jgi:hypothetical protein
MTTTTRDGHGFVDLFDGCSLDGWFIAPRILGSVWPGGPDVSEIYSG